MKEKAKKFKETKSCNEKMNKNSKERGITLIALIVTIIVLLILAGVTIATLTGENGIITKAIEARERTNQASAEEQVRLAVAASIGIDGKINLDELNKELENIDAYYKENPISSTNKIEEGDFPAVVTVDGYEVIINENGSIGTSGGSEEGGDTEDTLAGKYYEEDTNIQVGETPVTIPGGATISGIEGEYENIDDGFVIYITKGEEIEDWNADTNENEIKDVQENYDQFVWVPVKTAYITETEIADQTGSTNYEKLQNYITETNEGKTENEQIYPMAIQLSGGTYKGILYNFTEEGGEVKVTPLDYTTTSSNREPAFLTNSSYADGSSYNNVGITQDPDSLQAEYKAMVEKVNKNKGFWVGRYETSHMVDNNSQDNTNEIKVIKGTTEGINNVNWYRMYAQQKSYSSLGLNSGSTITSSMIWGSQWDQIMIWMKGIENTVNSTNGRYYVTNSIGMGNYGISGEDDYDDTSNPAETGCYDVKNIFDLAGNIYDFTLEADDTNVRVERRRRLLLYR